MKTDPYSENIEDLYQNAPCGYFSMLAGGMIISINNTLLKWLDFNREEVVYEMMFQDLLRAGGKIYLQTHLMPILQIDKEVSEINLELRGRGSIKIPALINAKKEETSDGQSFYRFSVLDISQRKLYENELIKARKEAEKKAERLRQVNEELERFANRASHDLQAPLNTLSGIVFLLEKKGLIIENEESEKLLNIIDRNTRRMRNMIRDLLEHSKMDSDSADFESVSLNEVCKEAVELLNDKVKSIGADFKISDLPEVKGIKSQLVSLFQNLFSNAIKYRSEKYPVITVGSEVAGDYCSISVSDNGMGFDQKYKDKIFEFMERLHSNDSIEGTGIGLSTCKRIAENHSWQIEAESELGEGSTFYLKIPVTELSKSDIIK